MKLILKRYRNAVARIKELANEEGRFRLIRPYKENRLFVVGFLEEQEIKLLQVLRDNNIDLDKFEKHLPKPGHYSVFTKYNLESYSLHEIIDAVAEVL